MHKRSSHKVRRSRKRSSSYPKVRRSRKRSSPKVRRSRKRSSSYPKVRKARNSIDDDALNLYIKMIKVQDKFEPIPEYWPNNKQWPLPKNIKISYKLESLPPIFFLSNGERIRGVLPYSKKMSDYGLFDRIKIDKSLITKGLILDNKPITSITGPINLNILKPEMSFHKEFNAPIFILFGDQHHSKEHFCTNCTCETNIQKPCCYKIFSDDFLKILDNVGSDPKYPVDFSIEGGLSGKQKDFDKKEIEEYVKFALERGTPMSLLRDRLIPCYSRNIKETDLDYYKKTCPTINIRWQLADSRQTDFDYNSGYKYNFGKFLIIMGDFFKILKKKEINENDIFFLVNENVHIINEKYLEALKHIVDEDFFDYIDKDTSLIFKQLKKLPENQQKDWENWIKQYYRYIYNKVIIETKYLYKIEKLKEIITKIISFLQDFIKYYNLYGTEGDDKYFDKQQEIQDDLIKYVENEDKKSEDGIYGFYKIYNISDFISTINLIDLDLYFVLRSFKKPEGSNNPLVSIGYFGATHCENIVHFLMNIIGEGKYEEVYKKDEIKIGEEFSRCLEIDKLVDLDEVIDSYKK